jgi:hypothetical protein
MTRFTHTKPRSRRAGSPARNDEQFKFAED